MCYTYDKSKGGDTRELQSRMVTPPPQKKKIGSSHLKCCTFLMEMIIHSHANKTHFSFSQESLCTWPHFESEGFWNSEVLYLATHSFGAF